MGHNRERRDVQEKSSSIHMFTKVERNRAHDHVLGPIVVFGATA